MRRKIYYRESEWNCKCVGRYITEGWEWNCKCVGRYNIEDGNGIVIVWEYILQRMGMEL